MEMTLLGAIAGGVLTLLSPCSVMLLPAFFSYAFNSTGKLLARTGVFYLGLITTLVPWGMLAGSLGGFLNQHRDTFITVAAWVVSVLGIIMILNIPIPYLTQPRGNTAAGGSGNLSVYTLGMVYGLAGICAGPLLGAVLTFAAASANALYGGVILLAFALGMVIPLFILSVLWDKIPAIKNLVRPRPISIGRWHTTWTTLIGGIFTLGVGILLLVTSGTQTLDGILSASTQAQLEFKAGQLAAQIPDWVVVTVLVVIVAVVLLMVRRRRQNNAPAPETADTSRSPRHNPGA